MASILGSDARLHGGSLAMLSLDAVLERDEDSELPCRRRMRDLVLALLRLAGVGRGRDGASPSSVCCRLLPLAGLKQLSRILLRTMGLYGNLRACIRA